MNTKYEPWGESHAPKRFYRVDPTGGHTPLMLEEEEERNLLRRYLFTSRIETCLWGIAAVVFGVWVVLGGIQ